MQRILLYFFIFSTTSLFATKDTTTSYFEAQQTKISAINTKLFSAKTDEERQKLNTLLLATLEETLNQPNSFEFPFDSLKKDIGILTSPDNKFRIINWNVEKSDGTHQYYGFIQEKYLVAKKKIESVLLFPLIDKSTEIRNPENTVSDNKKWFGMLYYKIIPVKSKKKTYYTLLARDMNDKLSQKKIIDVLSFDSNGNPKFGADVFSLPKKYPKRVIFEYASSCVFALKYNESLDMIVYDRLAPMEPQLEGQYQYYCTSDFEYDGLKFKKGKWQFQADIAPKNQKDNTDKHYNKPDGDSSKSQSDTVVKRVKRKKK
ncbi:MAG: hypothetical protein IPH89_09840 [Bacteroidetes bacterium]|jgi:hypothetical protein|nr:hypothetical protein [Bacteroidota bacterium]